MDFLRRNKNLLLSAGFFILLVLVSLATFSRPGGGGGFSSGGGGGGGGGGGSSGGGGGFDLDDLEAIIYLIYLIFRYPHISGPILIALFIWYKIDNWRKPKNLVSNLQKVKAAKMSNRLISNQVVAFQKEDPDFSKVLFIDFANYLYYQYHFMRSKPESENLSPYLSPGVREEYLKERNYPLEVSEIVIGTSEIKSLFRSADYTTITMEFFANFTETRGKESLRIIQKEIWSFRRKKGVRSKGPEMMTNPGCPNCGSPSELTLEGNCKYCGSRVTPGELQWEIFSIRRNTREVQKGSPFGAYAPEVGTDWPTVMDPGFTEEANAFIARHKIPNPQEFQENFRNKVVKPMMEVIYRSYSELDWEIARPLMTDNLFRSHFWWIKAYKKNKLRNSLKDLVIHSIDPVKIETDKYYETLTVRITASVIDTLVNENGVKQAGSNSPRKFSEYWTFIRRTGVEKDVKLWKPDQCPNCGAPLNIGMSGICAHCNAKVTTGEFSWVLAIITQDEVYTG